MAFSLAPMDAGSGSANSPSLPQSFGIVASQSPSDSTQPGAGTPNNPLLPWGFAGAAVNPGGGVVVAGSQQHWGST